MPKISRLSGNSDWIDLDFVERERTPEPAMKLGIQMHLAGLSLSNTISVLDELGVQRSRKAVHDWVQKADLQPTSGKNPNHVSVHETVIRINDRQYWLYAAADPDTNKLLHLRLFSTTKTALTEISLRELRQNHNVEDVPRNLRFLVCERIAKRFVNAMFLVDGANHLQAALHRAGLRFQTERHGNRNAVERIFREVKHRTSSFSNCFSHVERRPLKNGSKASLAGIMLQTKHYP